MYGAKVRFPHALVMQILFGSGSVQDRARAIVTATWTHSRNLAIFALIYKSVVCLLRLVRSTKQSGNLDDVLNIAIAGAVGGFVVFGRENPINSQINMSVHSRSSVSLTHAIAHKVHLISIIMGLLASAAALQLDTIVCINSICSCNA